MNQDSQCPLCLHTPLFPYFEDKFRHYLICPCCDLVSVPDNEHLSSKDEKAEYDKHNNTQGDAGYQRFLGRTWFPLLERLKLRADFKSLRCLDFGCGEGAVLSAMAKQDRVKIANYDLYYHPNDSLLFKDYDVIIMTEVIEHVADARGLLNQVDNMLLPKGIVAIMTKRVIDQQAFSRWHYKNDKTHINFYSNKTFEWLAADKGWQIEFIDNDVVFLTKS